MRWRPHFHQRDLDRKRPNLSRARRDDEGDSSHERLHPVSISRRMEAYDQSVVRIALARAARGDLERRPAAMGAPRDECRTRGRCSAQVRPGSI